jgi:hypothetical protein
MTPCIRDVRSMSFQWVLLALLLAASQIAVADPWVSLTRPAKHMPVANGTVECRGNFSAGIERINVYVDAAYAGSAALNPTERTWSFTVDFTGTPRQVRVVGFDDLDARADAGSAVFIAGRVFGAAENFPLDNAGVFLREIAPLSSEDPATLSRWSLREESGDVRLYQRGVIDNDTHADWITLPRCGPNPNFELHFELKPVGSPGPDDRFLIALNPDLRVILASTAGETRLADASGAGFSTLATATAPGLGEGWAAIKIRRFGQTLEVVRDSQIILTFTSPAVGGDIDTIRLGNGVDAAAGIYLDEISLGTLSPTGAAKSAPTVTWLTPTEPEIGQNAFLAVDPTVDLRWDIDSAGLDTVEVYAGAGLAGSASYDSQEEVWTLPWAAPSAGPQMLRLRLTDTEGDSYCYRPVPVELVEAEVPLVHISSPDTRRIRLADSDDGLLLRGEAQSILSTPLTVQWSLIEASSGGNAVFENFGELETSVTFDLPGTYQIRLSATDSEGTASTELEVLVGITAPDAPISRLIAYYPLDTDFTNASGPAPDAVTVGGAAIANAAGLGGSVLLDGSDDRVDIPLDSAINNSFSERAVSVWFKPQSASLSGTRVIFEEGGTSRALVIYLHDGTLYAGGYNINNNTEFYASATNYFEQDWNHVVLTTDTLESRVYLNGVFLQTGPALELPDHGDPNALGGVNIATRLHTGDLFGGGFYAGWIDELRLYDSHLSAAEVTELFENFAPEAPAVDSGEEFSALATMTVNLAANAMAEPDSMTTWQFLGGPESVTIAGTTFVPAVPGVYLFRFKSELPPAITFDDLTVTASPISYTEFIGYHHPEMTGDDALPSADWDGDQLANELEFRMGTELTGETLQTIRLLSADAGWEFVYPSNPAVASGPRPMLSVNLAGWSEAVDGQDGITAEREGSDIRLFVPHSFYTDRLFMRLVYP